MNRVFTYEITEEWESIRDFLKMRRYPHAVFVKLKRTEGSVLVNGEWLHLYKPLHVGDILEIHLEEQESSENIVPRDFGEIVKPGSGLPLPIVYEDADLLVLNKPAGLPIHPSQNHYEDSLANAVMGYYHQQGEPFVFRCINRLDRNTSGLTLIAKNMLSAAILSQDVTTRDIHRTYLALVEADTEAGQSLQEHGTVDAPIARVDGSTILREVNWQDGDRAVTHYWKLQEEGGIALLKLQLETGRTHQIRVHMRCIGHPLLGDDLYGHGAYIWEDPKTGSSRVLQRHGLHSYKLEFTHPITGEAMEFTASLPEDMAFPMVLPMFDCIQFK